MGSQVYVLDAEGRALTHGAFSVRWDGHGFRENSSGGSKVNVSDVTRRMYLLSPHGKEISNSLIAERAEDPRVAQFAEFLEKNHSRLPKVD